MVMSRRQTEPIGKKLVRLPSSVAVPAWTISILCHLAVIVLVLVWAGSAVREADPELEVEREVVMRFAGEAPPIAPEVPDQVPEQPAPNESATGVSPAPIDDRISRELDEALRQPLPAPAAVGPRQALVDGPPLGFSTGFRGGLSTDLDHASTLPRVNLPGAPLGRVETQFFGAAAQGTKFVYVIDRSASMQFALATAKAELLSSLQKLPPTAEFQVVVYDLEPQLLRVNGPYGLMPATKENKQQTARFLDTIRSEGGTDHVKAIKRALTLSPDVVYFLTDADELKPGQVQELTALNHRSAKASIHCIELSLDNLNRKDNPMRVLARDNRGVYQGIDLTRFPQPKDSDHAQPRR